MTNDLVNRLFISKVEALETFINLRIKNPFDSSQVDEFTDLPKYEKYLTTNYLPDSLEKLRKKTSTNPYYVRNNQDFVVDGDGDWVGGIIFDGDKFLGNKF